MQILTHHARLLGQGEGGCVFVCDVRLINMCFCLYCLFVCLYYFCLYVCLYVFCLFVCSTLWLREILTCVCISGSELQAARAVARLLCHAHSPAQVRHADHTHPLH